MTHTSKEKQQSRQRKKEDKQKETNTTREKKETHPRMKNTPLSLSGGKGGANQAPEEEYWANSSILV